MKIATPQSLPAGDSSSAGITRVDGGHDEGRFRGGQRTERLASGAGGAAAGGGGTAGCGCASASSEIPAAIAVLGKPCTKQESAARQ